MPKTSRRCQDIFFVNSNSLWLIKKVTKIAEVFTRNFNFMTLIGDFFTICRSARKAYQNPETNYNKAQVLIKNWTFPFYFSIEKQQNIIFESTSLDHTGSNKINQKSSSNKQILRMLIISKMNNWFNLTIVLGVWIEWNNHNYFKSLQNTCKIRRRDLRISFSFSSPLSLSF